jgi:geranylgeranyl reductase family protein
MTSNFRYDVAIVGAGPAGSVLAYELAKKGVKVILLEKNPLPYRKVCAGGITVRAASVLPPDIHKVVEGTIQGARLSYNRISKKVRTYDKPIIYTVTREKFDSLLASRAIQAGTALRDNTEVKTIEIRKDSVLIGTRRETYSIQVLVGADGANSSVVHALGLGKGYEYGLGINCDIEAKSEKLKEWQNLIGLDYGIPGGYSWVFPKSSYLSIGSGGPQRVSNKLKPYVLGLMHNYGLDANNGVIIRGHLMPIRKATTPLSLSRVLLVGDAAGLIDPLTGEGIYYAVRSSYLAVPPILSMLQGQTRDLLEYDEAINREFNEEFKIARTIRKMNSIAPWLFFHWLKDSDRFWRAFCRLLRGEKTYVGLRSSLGPPLQWLFH